MVSVMLRRLVGDAHSGIPSTLIVAAVVLVTLIAVLVPFSPVMPGVGLDLSWQFGINQAVAQGLPFGSQIVFTFGPYGAVYSRMFHPATDALMIGGSLYLALSYWACLVFLMRTSGRRWPLLFCFVLAGLVTLRDPLLFCYPLLVGLAAYQLIFADERPVLDGPWAPWLIALLFAPLGLLPLVKGSILILCAATTGLCAIAFVGHRRLLAALVCVAAPAIAMAVCWLLAGQPLTALPDYFTGMLPIASGYTEAMAVEGHVAEVWLFLIACLSMLLVIAIQRKISRPARVFLLLIFSLYLFIAFKAGFVRHDGHAMIAGVGMLLAALLLPFAFSNKSTALLIAVALCCWWQIDRQYARTTVPGVVDSVASTYANAWRGLVHRLAGDGRLDNEFRKSVASIRAQAAFPVLAGTTDVYSFDQEYLIASGNTWSPRPVFQSYSAYTPGLAEKNRQFLLGAHAPDNILFRMEPIDGRVPSLEDGASWPVLLQRYKPVRLEHDFLVLRKDPRPTAFEAPRRVASGSYELGQRIALPQSGLPLFARMTIRPNWLGRLAEFAFKPSQLHIELELADGSKRQFRIVSSMAESGFLISPLIEDAAEFNLLYGKPGWLDGKRVTAMTMLLPGRRSHFWEDRYDVTFSQVRTVASANLSTLVQFDPFDESMSDSVATVADACDGSIDKINHSPTAAGLSASGVLEVDGWLAPSVARGKLADAVYVVLTDVQGHRHYLKTHLSPRPDVAAYFKNPAIGNAGYSAVADISDLNGDYGLGLAFRSAGELKVCPQFKIPVKIGK
jgi:hypothetical protein